MINTQGIVITFIIIGLMCGMLVNMDSDGTFKYDILDEMGEKAQSRENSMTSESGIWGTITTTVTKIYENTIGNVIKWGLVILDFVKDAMNPFSIYPSMYNDPIFKALAYGLMIFRSFLTFIFGLEIYNVIKNKKTS